MRKNKFTQNDLATIVVLSALSLLVRIRAPQLPIFVSLAGLSWPTELETRQASGEARLDMVEQNLGRHLLCLNDCHLLHEPMNSLDLRKLYHSFVHMTINRGLFMTLSVFD